MTRLYDFRDPYDIVRNQVEADLVAVDTGTESFVQQGPAVDADINVIVRRFGMGESIPPAALDPSYYGDVGEIPDLGTALRIVKEARDRFDALPVDIRNRFANSPARLWDFVNNPANEDESVRLGLLVRPAAPAAELAQAPATSPSPEAL